MQPQISSGSDAGRISGELKVIGAGNTFADAENFRHEKPGPKVKMFPL